MSKITDWKIVTTPAIDDWIAGVDKSDTSEDAAGTSMKVALSNIHKGLTYAGTTETTAGTATVGPISPNDLRGSDYGKRAPGLVLVQSDTPVTVADGKDAILIPAEFNGWNVVDVIAGVTDKGVTGTTDIQLRRRRAGVNVDVLSTKVTIGDEWFANDGIVDTDNDDLQTGDQLFFDRDAVHSGTAPNGLSAAVVIQKPGA